MSYKIEHNKNMACDISFHKTWVQTIRKADQEYFWPIPISSFDHFHLFYFSKHIKRAIGSSIEEIFLHKIKYLQLIKTYASAVTKIKLNYLLMIDNDNIFNQQNPPTHILQYFLLNFGSTK